MQLKSNSRYNSKITKKNGIQVYKCYACGKQFLVKKKLILDEEQLWIEYVKGKQTYAQLAEKHACSAKTIKRKLDSYSVKKEGALSQAPSY